VKRILKPRLNRFQNPPAGGNGRRAGRGFGAPLWPLVGLLFFWAAQASGLTPQETMTQLAHSAWGPKLGIASVAAITQTQDGYLWIGTSEGLFRFDGISFFRWQPRLGETIPGTGVTALCAGSDGSLWIGFNDGVSRLHDGNLTSYASTDGLPPGEITSILEDRQGIVWVATTKGLGKYAGGRWTSPGRENSLPEGSVRVELEDRTGTLWLSVDDPSVAGGTLLESLRPGETRAERLPEHLGAVAKVCEAPDGQIWIAEATGAIRLLSMNHGKPTIQSPGLAVRSRDLLFDRDGTVWICTVGRGLLRFGDAAKMRSGEMAPPRLGDTFTEKDGLSSDFISCGFEDREGTLWFGSAGGLDRFRDNKIASYSVREGLNSDQRLMLAADAAGAIWTGSEQGLQRVNGRQIETLGLDWIGPGLVSGVYSFYAEKSGDVWVAAQNGVGHLKDGLHSPIKIDGGLEMNNVTAMTRDRADGLWLCDQLRGVCRVVNGKPRIFPSNSQLPATVVNAAITDTQGRVWLGFQDGSVCIYEDGGFHRQAVPQSVMAMLCDRKGRVWVAGLGGLSCFKNDHFETITAQNGLPSTQLSGIVEDNHGTFWLAGHSAIIRVEPKELDEANADASHLIQSEVYDAADGLRGFPRQSRPFPIAAKAEDGRLWFATTAGLAMIDPDHVRRNINPPPVHILQAIVDGKVVEVTPNRQFSAGTKDVKIDYTALSLVDPDKVRFRCYLEGYDVNWHEVSTLRQVSYPNLSPRNYCFQVTACNNDGVWADPGVTWKFSIRPAVYQTTWFFALAGGCFLLLFLGVYRWLLARATARTEARMNTRMEAQLDERKRIAQELHDTVLQGFTGVRLKLWAITHQLPESMTTTKEQLNNVIRQTDQCLKESRSSVWSLRSPRLEEAADLASALSQAAAQLVAGTPSRLNFKVAGTPRKLSGIVEFNLLRIGEEAVTNAVKHSAASTIDVQIRFEHHKVVLQVNDDGRGFDPEHVPVAQMEHQGLAGIRDRTGLLGGTLAIKSRPGAHTEILVTVPA